MLERLLYEICNGGTLEVSALAARLDTSPAMVQAMLEHLQRLGYIQPYGESCGDGCGGCNLSQTCKPAAGSNKINMWKYQE